MLASTLTGQFTLPIRRRRIRLVTVTTPDLSVERLVDGTWHSTGDRHFVEHAGASSWRILTPGMWGLLRDDECRVMRGPVAWVRCRLFEGKLQSAQRSRKISGVDR